MHVAMDIVEDENASGYVRLSTSHASLDQVASTLVCSDALSSATTEFFCHICQEIVSVNDDSVQLTACGHRFCISCIRRYLEHRIREGHVDLICFHQENNVVCNQSILEEDIKMLMSPYLWDKYLIFKFKRANATSRECPKCHHHQAFPHASTKFPLCKCEKCSYCYCFAHSDAHLIVENTNVACIDYQQQTDRADPWSVALIRETCQACPNCGQYVEKDGGCNQILCLSCRTTFCWLCLEKIDDSAFPVHYQWWNVRGCPGNQMVDLETLTKYERFCSMALRVFFIVVVGPPALLITIVASILCCFCIPIVHMFETTQRQAFTTCLCISGYIVIAPILALISLFTCSWFCVRDCREPNELVNTLASESVSTLPRYERDADNRIARMA